MYNIKIVVLIIAVNVVKAENITPTDVLSGKSHTQDKTANADQDTYVEGKEERSGTSMEQSDEYDSRSAIEESADKEETRRYAENLKSTSDEENRNADQEDRDGYVEEESKMAKQDSNQKVRSTNLRDDEGGINIDPTKRKMMTHHVMLDTKGRSAAEDANQDVLKTVLTGLGSLEDPRLFNQRNGHLISRYPTITRPGMFYSPNIYTVHHPPVIYNRPSSAEQISIPINPMKRSNENFRDINSELPYINTNSYPYQVPLTKIGDPAHHQEPNKIDILKKLIDATNSALTPSSDKSIAYIEPFNMFPGNINPFTTGRFRRSVELKINSLRTM